jgi:hypothetical protein
VRSGARPSTTLAIPASPFTLLRLVRALPEKPVGAVKVLGVDDFAIRTCLCDDLDRH